MIGKEADDVIVTGHVVLAELRLYWPSYSVSAEFVAHMIRTVFCHINVAGGMLVRSILPEGGSGETNHHDIVCK